MKNRSLITTIALMSMSGMAAAQDASIYNDAVARCRQISDQQRANQCVAQIDAAYARAQGRTVSTRSAAPTAQERQQQFNSINDARNQANVQQAQERVRAQQEAQERYSRQRAQERAEALAKARTQSATTTTATGAVVDPRARGPRVTFGRKP